MRVIFLLQEGGKEGYKNVGFKSIKVSCGLQIGCINAARVARTTAFCVCF